MEAWELSLILSLFLPTNEQMVEIEIKNLVATVVITLIELNCIIPDFVKKSYHINKYY